MGIQENRSLPCQPIDMRSCRLRMTTQTTDPVILIVYGNHQDVRWLGSTGRGLDRAQSRECQSEATDVREMKNAEIKSRRIHLKSHFEIRNTRPDRNPTGEAEGKRLHFFDIIAMPVSIHNENELAIPTRIPQFVWPSPISGNRWKKQDWSQL